MNERDFHRLLQDWLVDEAPREAPDWIVYAAVERTAGMAPTKGRQLRGWVLAAAIVLLTASLVGVATLAALNLRPFPEAREPTVLRTFAIGARNVVGAAVLANSVWIGDVGAAGVLRVDAATGEVLERIATYDRQPPRIDTHSPLVDVLAAFGSVWTVDDEFGTVTRIDPGDSRVVARIDVGDYPTAAAGAAGALWVASAVTGSVSRIDPAADRVDAVISLPVTGLSRISIAGDDRGVWVAAGGVLYRIDPARRLLVAEVPIGGTASAVAVQDVVWVADDARGYVWRVDPEGNRTMGGFAVGTSPNALSLAGTRVWVGDRTDGVLRALDIASGEVVAELPSGTGISDLAVGETSLWVLSQVDATLSEVALGP